MKFAGQILDACPQGFPFSRIERQRAIRGLRVLPELMNQRQKHICETYIIQLQVFIRFAINDKGTRVR